jgi:iron complex transport system substrate-binding protein
MQKSTTRRRLLQGLTVGAVGSIAGCTAGSPGSQSGTPTESSSSKSDSTSTESGSYSVSMAPVGKITFEEVPTKWLASTGSWADMGLALGRDPPSGMWQVEHYFTQPYYEEIPDISVDKSEIIDLVDGGGVSPEVFYEIAADVHVMDPIRMINRFKSFERTDIERIKKTVAPFFGNYLQDDDYAWHDYPYYTLYEAFGKLAQVFQQQERYKAFAKLHKEVQQTIETSLPTGKHPSVALLFASSNKPEKLFPYTIDKKGTSHKQWRDLEVRDAFADTSVKDAHAPSGGIIDYETLLAIDPDVLMLRGHERQTAKQFQKTVVEFMMNHPVASELSAVKQGNVFRGGPFFQGPIQNLVLTERAANQLYPDAFSGVTLYDPQHVADIVHGRF